MNNSDQATTQMNVYCDFFPEHARNPNLVNNLRNSLINECTNKVEVFIASFAE